MPEPDDELSELTEVDVLTLGLVTTGANQEAFYLTKAEQEQEGTMPEETKNEATSPEQGTTVLPEATNLFEDSGFFNRLKELMGGTVREELAKAGLTDKAKKAVAAAIRALEGAGDELPAGAKTALKALQAAGQANPGRGARGGGEEEEEEYGYPAPTKKDDEALEKALDARLDARLEALEKAHQGQIEALEKANQETRAALEKAQQEAEAQRQEVERREYVEKAGSFGVLPVQRTELGQKLYALSKAVPDDLAWWMELLKAADAQLGAAGIFNEMGTSRTPEELEVTQKVEKAVAEGKSDRDALLGLSPEDQERMRSDQPYGTRR